MNPLLYVLIGAVEWGLALLRTGAVIDGRRWRAAGIVFVEQCLGLWVLSRLVVSLDWPAVLAYAAGGAIGAIVSVRNGMDTRSR